MSLLPPVTQEFRINAAGYLAGIDEMLAGTNKLAESLNVVTTSTDRLAGASETVARSSNAVMDSINAGTVAVERQGIAVASLVEESRALAIAVDEAAVAIDRENVALDASIASSAKAGGGAAAMGSHLKTAFLGIGAAVAYSVYKGAQFQEQVTRLYTAAGLVGTSAKTVSKDLLNLGDQVGYTGTQLAEAMYHPISAGLSYAAALKVVAYSAQLAQIHGANLEDTTYALSSVMKAYNVDAGHVGKTSALLNAIVGQGDMRFQDFVQSIKNWTPTGAAMGISIQSMGAAIAYLTDRGNSAEVASTRLTMGLSMVTSGSKQANTYLSALGLTTGTLSLRNQTLQSVMLKAGLTTNKIANDLRKPDGIYVALKDIKGAFEKAGLSANQADQVMAKIFGGGRSDKAMLSLMSNVDGLRIKYGQIGHAVSGYGSSWAKTQATVAFEFHKVVAAVQNLAISFGQVLLPAASKVLGALAKVFGFLQKNPVLAATAGAIIAIAVGFKIAATAAGGVSTAISLIGKAAAADVPEVTALSAAMDANVIGVVVLALIALVAGLYELYKHCKVVRDIVHSVADFFKRAWADAMHIAGAVIKWFTDGPLKFIKEQFAVFRQWWQQNHAEIMTVVKVVWRFISVFIGAQIVFIVGVVRVALTVLKAVWNVAWAVIKDTVIMAWHVIADTVRTVIHVVLDVISVVLALLTGHWSKAWADVKKLCSDALHGVVSLIKDIGSGFGKLLWDAGKALLIGLINGIKSMFGAVAKVVSDLAHGIVSWFTGSSPNPGMAAAGASAGASLANGLASQNGAVAAAAYGLGATARASLQQGLIAGRGGGNGVNWSQGGRTIGHTTLTAAQIQQELQNTLANAAANVGAGAGGGGGGGGGGGTGTGKTSASPLKTLHDLGLMLGRALVLGLEGTAGQVRSAAAKLATIVKDAVHAGFISYQRGLKLTDWIERDNIKLQGLANRRAALLKTIATAQKYATSTAANVVSWVSLSNAMANTPQGGGISGAGLLASLQGDLATIKQFNAAIQKLAKLGLNKNLLNQIIQAGPVDGLTLANALLSGPVSQIKQLNTTETQIESASKTIGQTAANAMYDTGKNAGKGFLSGLEAQQKAIERLMAKIADSMIKRLKKDLGISSPSSVMKHHGLMIAQGLADGLDDGRGLVAAAAGRLAGAATLSPRGAAGLGGGGTTVIHNHFSITAPNGFIGSDAHFLQALAPVVQKALLQLEGRNSTPQTTLRRAA